MEKYRSIVNTTVEALRKLREGSGGQSVGILAISPVPHFPEIDGELDQWTAERLDSSGSYKRLALGSLAWLHRLLQGDNTSANALARALGVTSAQMMSYRGESSRLEPSLALGKVVKLRRALGQSSQRSAFWAFFGKKRSSLLTRAGMLNAYRVKACQPSRSPAGVMSSSWRHEIEAASALSAGVPLLDSFAARQLRWDLHPGLQGGPAGTATQLSNRFDCMHSSLEPGSYDAEVTQLQKILQE
eukprot:CAMPEP_0182835552 /NCGR_PEP_ID=MMETSP0006_2-20121128/21575_1 /TAXON_ID=97485 /ORGANISM="Prymnesium parvum, Strain Texoma1" /LENGTH=243 /DNA_ID=CAMNT_0024964005 /DNA_START=172 /DNA_END=901 /DNA_ORIENTATION=-